jgi:RNA polymerase sigma-70 factor (ECF subfamily)
LEESASQEPSPDISANQQQEIQLLKQALARLPIEKREVLVLSRIQELKCEEIAKIVRCEPGTVRVRVHRALQELKVILSRLMKEEAI